VIAQIRAVRLDDQDSHTRLVLALQMSGAVPRYLWNAINDGTRASEQLKVRGSRID
jgi:hypothetical protein